MVAIVIGIVAFAIIYLIIDAQQMNDQERAKIGLGPKGQGRR